MVAGCADIKRLRAMLTGRPSFWIHSLVINTLVVYRFVDRVLIDGV